MRPVPLDAPASDRRGVAIVRSLEAAPQKLASGIFVGEERKALLDDIEAAKHLVLKELELEAGQTRFVELITQIQRETLAARDEAAQLRERSQSLQNEASTRLDQAHEVELKLADAASRIDAIADRERAITQREQTLAEREVAFDTARRDAGREMDERRSESLEILERIKEDSGRIAAIEARERSVADREDILAKREETVALRGADSQAAAERAEALQARLEELCARALDRLESIDARELRIADETKRLDARERAVESWKVDLSAREAALAARLDELPEIDRRKEALERELGALREQRFAEVERARSDLAMREADLTRRDAEAQTMVRALAAREGELRERAEKLDARGRELRAQEIQIADLRRDLDERASRVTVLEGRVSALEAQRKELQQSLAKLRGRL